MAKKKKAGRPKGSKNKTSTLFNDLIATAPRKRGRPAGIKSKKRGRPAGKNSLIAAGGHIHGIHFIGKSLIVDTDLMNVDEVIFLGGKAPKVR